MAQSGQKLSLGVYIFPDVEVLDFAGPFEVFSVASEIIGKEKLEVFTIGDSLNSLTTIGNLTVKPAKSFDSVEQLDFLVIPGGDGSKRVIEKQNSLNQLNRLIQSSRWTMTV
ncbi:MAG TPA: AraC family transcriptional regulator, partial [Algoriphagus sp.]|nr:AraC family transcriptional regulator [Algoriphagus sp.]